MGGYGVNDINAGAGEGVCRMVNGADLLTSGLLQGREPVGVETCVGTELAKVRGFSEGDLVRRSWVDRSKERILKPSLRIRLR